MIAHFKVILQKFSNNKASHYGGYVHFNHNSDILFEGSALITFHYNSANDKCVC